MRIGVSLRTAFATDDPRQGARWVLERAEVVAEVGLDSLFVGDQHSVPVPYYQNTPILARILAGWDDRPCGALYLLPLWHPVIVAEQVGTLAALAQGPFVLQCALGGGPHQFASMGVDMRRRVRDFETGLDVIRRLLAGEAVTAEEPVPIQGAMANPHPTEPVEVWIGADVDNAIGRAARLGDAWYAGPNLVVAEAAEKLALYRSRLAAEGRTASCFPLRRDVHVAGSAAEADEVRAWVAATGYRGIDPSALVIGSVDEVADQLRPFAELGFTDVICRQLTDDHPRAVASLRRLGEVRTQLTVL